MLKKKFSLRYLFKLIIIIFSLVFLISSVVFTYFYFLSLKFDLNKIGKLPERTRVFDRNGKLIGKLHGENRKVVNLSKVSKYFIDAVIAREDARFYWHFGIDFISLARAGYQNYLRKKRAQGGSTITMQLVRNSFGLFDKSFKRKFLEMVLAMRTEIKFSKQDILEFYVNRIFFGTGLYGVEKAARKHFGKSAHELSLGESAMLAGIIRSPNKLSPFRHKKDAIAERNHVLKQMLEQKKISLQEFQKAKARDEFILKQGAKSLDELFLLEENYALSTIRSYLNEILLKTETEDGGLKIITTIDYDLQLAAENALEEHLSFVENKNSYYHQKKNHFKPAKKSVPSYIQGAVMVIDNFNGAIRAMVGGRDFKHSPFNRAIQATRQVGSLFKPFVFAAAYQKGLLPGTLINDDPINIDELFITNAKWSPENSDGKNYGLQPAEWGLIKSRNTMSVRVGQYAGFKKVSYLAGKAGLSSKLETSPVSYLGTVDESLLRITSAYAIFPNNGIKKRPYLLEKILAADGTLLYEAGIISNQVLEEQTAWLVHRGLSRVFQSGTAANARHLGFNKAAAGKTGTTDNFKDAWFVGYTKGLTCGVWVGMDNNKRTIYRGYGSTLALPIWVKIMQISEKFGFNMQNFSSSLQFAQGKFCRLSGNLATNICNRRKFSYVDTLPVASFPQKYCSSHPQRHPGSNFQRYR